MRLALALAASLALASPALASDHVLTLDATHAKVTFLLGATGHDVEGSFPLGKCDVHFDPETGDASGEITLDAAHGVTGNDKRDRTMREKVLLTDANPSIVFHPKHFEGTLPESGTGEVRLDGAVTVAGAEHPISLVAHVERNGSAVHPTSTLDVPFVDWGMKDPSVMFLKVQKVVHVTIAGDATLAVATPAEPQPVAAAPGN